MKRCTADHPMIGREKLTGSQVLPPDLTYLAPPQSCPHEFFCAVHHVSGPLSVRIEGTEYMSTYSASQRRREG